MEKQDRQIHLFHHNKIMTDENLKKDFLQFLDSSKNICILIDNTDDSFLYFQHDITFWKKVKQISNENNIDIKIMNIGNQKIKLEFDSFKYISFPLAHLYGTYDTIRKHRVNYQEGIVTKKKFNPPHFIKCFNRQPHYSRCVMIDTLEKYNLLTQKSLVSWNILSGGGYVGQKYEFKYWKERKMELDSLRNWSSQYTSRIMDTDNALFHLVGETPVENIGFTEKTWKPILNGEIFILYGVTRQNEQLKRYGFKIFDNIINYKFDYMKDIHNSVEEIVKQLKKFERQDYNDIYQKCTYIIEHNYKNALYIIQNKKFLPNTLMDIQNLIIHSNSYNLIPILKSNMSK